MATASLKDIIASLSSLSAEERAEVVRWCDALGVQSLVRQDNATVEHVYSELTTLISKFYHTPQASLTTFVRYHTATYRKLLRATESLEKATNAWWPDAQRNVHFALVRLLCRVAFDASTKRAQRVNWAQLIAALDEIEATVNAAFPGWIHAGLFQQRALDKVTTNARHKPDTEAVFG